MRAASSSTSMPTTNRSIDLSTSSIDRRRGARCSAPARRHVSTRGDSHVHILAPELHRKVKRLIDPAILESRSEMPARGVEEAAGEHHGAIEDVADAVDLDPAVSQLAVALEDGVELLGGRMQAAGVALRRFGDEAGAAVLP